MHKQRFLKLMSTFLLILLVSSSQPIKAFRFSPEQFGSQKEEKSFSEKREMAKNEIIDGSDLALLGNPHVLKALAQKCFFTSHILVKFSQSLDNDSIDDLLIQAKSSLLSLEMPRTGYSKISIPFGKTPEEFVAEMQANPDIIDAQLDFICHISKTPNDPFFGYQWNFRQIGAEYAWDLTSGGHSDVIVAILDTGVAYENYDQFTRASDLSQTTFVKGYDFINSDVHPNDDEGHGTHVCGTIAQSTNNAVGVAGLAYRCRVMPLKILDQDGVGAASQLGEAIRYAVDNGASVINMSLGFEVGVNPGAIVHEAIQYAFDRGVICVAAAGNEASDRDYHGGVDYPAAYPECIAVGAVRVDKTRSYYSNYGDGLDCVAPGGDLRVNQNNDEYGDGILQQTFMKPDYSRFSYYFYQGTSMSCAHVSAAAALFKSRHGGDLTNFLSAIQLTSLDLGPSGYDPEYGHGLIKIGELIKKARPWGAND